jgi:hypothetical protein
VDFQSARRVRRGRFLRAGQRVKQRRLTALGESNDSYFHGNDYARIDGAGQACVP